MLAIDRGVAQLGESAAFGTQRSQVQILSPRIYLSVFGKELRGCFFLTQKEKVNRKIVRY